MSYRQFQTLIGHPAPGFLCEPAGRNPPPDRYTARVRHEVGEPAYSRGVAQLTKRLIPLGGEQLAAFYARHDGFTLYRDLHSDAAGVRLYALAEIEEETAGLRSWLEPFFEDNPAHPLAAAVAIGEAPHSGNSFAMTTFGPQVGQVFYMNHDLWKDEPFAASFDAFLTRVCTAPAQLLAEDLGCYARYSDNRTDIQWIPRKYLRDVANA